MVKALKINGGSCGTILIRTNERGYVNFTMRRKRFDAWKRTTAARELIKETANPFEVATFRKIRRVWTHPVIARRFANWLSADCGTKLEDHLDEEKTAETIRQLAEKMSVCESTFYHRNVIYLGHIGGGYYKYGHSSNFQQRKQAHLRNFGEFTLVQVCLCENGLLAERLLRGVFLRKKMCVEYRHNDVPLKEIVAIRNGDQLRQIVYKMEKLGRVGESVLELAQISLREKEAELERERLRLLVMGKVNVDEYFRMQSYRSSLSYPEVKDGAKDSNEDENQNNIDKENCVLELIAFATNKQ